jgi:hypothetical protein
MALTSLPSAPRLPTIEAHPLLVRIPRLAAPIRLPAAVTRLRAVRTQLRLPAALIPPPAVLTPLPAAATRLRVVRTQLRLRAAVILPPAVLTPLPAAGLVAAEAADLVAEAADPRTAVAAVVAPTDNSFLTLRKGPPLSIQAGLFVAALQIPFTRKPQLSSLSRVQQIGPDWAFLVTTSLRRPIFSFSLGRC